MRSLAEIVQLRTGACREAADVLPAIAAGEYPEPPRPDSRGEWDDTVREDGSVRGDKDPRDEVVAHVETCLRCQAELSAYRRLLAHLRELRDHPENPPDGGLAELLKVLATEPSAGTHWAVRVAYVGGITAVTAAAGAAGVLVWMSRRKPGLARAS